MLIEVKHTPITDRQRELVQGASEDFQYTAMTADLNKYDGGGTPWHWHEHFEIGLIRKGRFQLHLQGRSILLEEGQGYFINSNVLHRSTAIDASPMELHAQLFDRSILAGTRRVDVSYVTPVAECFHIDAILLKDETDGDMLASMESAFDAARGDAVGHELLISAYLGLFWNALIQKMEPELRNRNQSEPRTATRMKQMLSFIHTHYDEPLSVAQIAQEVGLCERECYRCFANTMDTTPVTYVNAFRIRMAAEKLFETDATVAEVAESCGFTNTSYFCSIFKREMNCTPSAYRKSRNRIGGL